MEAFADESVNEITIMCSTQSAKTLTILCLLAWAIAEDPGPILWVTASMQEARKLAKGRLIPLLEHCAPVASKIPRERGRRMTCEIYFPSAPLIICGSESEAALSSTPYRYVLLDEVRLYPAGALEQVTERMTSYTHNWKKVIISTPDLEQDALHRSFLLGDQRHYEIKCPGCGHFQELQWKEHETKGGLKWDTNEITKPGGRYNFDRLGDTVRYECEACGFVMKDNITDRKKLSGEGGGRYVVRNPNAPTNHRSYNWSKLLPWWPDWKKQVYAFLEAKAKLEWGDHHALKEHINHHRGQPWTDRLRYAADEKFIHLRARDYNPREIWADEARRFATIDVQGKGGRHFWILIRAWAPAARSRLLHYSRMWSIEEVRQLLADWNVSPDNVGIDAATFTSEVYKYVVESGFRWKAMKGDDKPFYRVADRNFIFTRSRADPAIGTALQGRVRPIDLFLWSKPSALDRLTLFQHGMSGDWQIYRDLDGFDGVDGRPQPRGVSDEYAQQVTAFERRERLDARGVVRTEFHAKREPHAADCEQMQIICAAATDLFAGTHFLTAPDLPLFTQPAAEPARSE